MDQNAERAAEVNKFATVFLTIAALSFILIEAMPNREQATLLLVVFGSTLALIGASMAEEREAARAQAGR